jgi:hypothetical protein
MNGRDTKCTQIGSEDLKKRHDFGDLDVDGRIILILNVKVYDVKLWTRFIWLGI